MKKSTFERLVQNISNKCTEQDYPLCYTKQGQIITMSNLVLYIGKIQDSIDLVKELNKMHYTKNS